MTEVAHCQTLEIYPNLCTLNKKKISPIITANLLLPSKKGNYQENTINYSFASSNKKLIS